MFGRTETNLFTNLNRNNFDNFNNIDNNSNNNNLNLIIDGNHNRLNDNYYDSNKTIDIESEDLNTATELIKELESELDDSRITFRRLLTDSSQTIRNAAKNLDISLDNAKCFYNNNLKRNINDEIETIANSLKYTNDEERDNQIAKQEINASKANGYQQSAEELHKKLKHSIVKSGLSSRRNLLQIA